MMRVGINRVFSIVIFFLFLSCKARKKVEVAKVEKIDSIINSEKPETKPLHIGVDFKDFGEIKIERNSIDWEKINVDSLMTVNFSLEKEVEINFEFKRSLIASRIPFHFKLKEEKNGDVTLLVTHLFNKIYVDSLVFSKKKGEYKLKEAFNIYYGKVDGNWVCPSKISMKESIVYLEDVLDSNKCVEIKSKD